MNKVDELRVVFSHMLGASRVQIPENNLDNLKLTREEDGEFETADPQFLLGSNMLEVLDPKMLGSSLKLTDFAALVLLRDRLDGKMDELYKMEYGKMEQPTLSKARRGAYIVIIDFWIELVP
ncbi:hypothetical protein Tco_0654969 [Tanacetum coccineum]|uniref:Uncharacterized protein n=1 Tax=Tanacetum coccineum TaxID=301880 RepID=A0ABQ4X5B9_9ASTR